MPAPTKGQLASVVDGLFRGAGLQGENAPDLADVVADAIAQALQMMLSMALVEPGIPTAGDPITQSGATSGPGKLSAPVTASMIEPIVSGLLAGKSIRGESAPGLAKAIAGTIAFGIEQFAANVKVAPGITIAGAVTAAPGTLM